VAIEAGQYLHGYQFIAIQYLFETEYDSHSLETSGKYRDSNEQTLHRSVQVLMMVATNLSVCG